MAKTKSAFDAGTLNTLQASVRTLFIRRAAISDLHLTHEEYINTFVPREVRQMFRDIADYAAPQAYGVRFTINNPDNEALKAMIRMPLREGHPNPPPIVRGIHVQHDAPTDVVERIIAWTVHGDPSREFGRVRKLLELLNETLPRKTIRYYWPTILTLCSIDPATQALGRHLQELKIPDYPTLLPRGFGKACRMTAETIANAQLIPTDVEDMEDSDVMLSMVTGQSYQEEFANFSGMA